MLAVVGDILNWTAAAIVFPLMMLPLAALLAPRGAVGAMVWAGLALTTAASGAAFAMLAPRLSAGDVVSEAPIFLGGVLVIAVLIAAAGGPARASTLLAAPFGVVARGAGRAVMWLVFAMALLQFAVVILRYVFGLNFLALQESVTYVHGAVFLIASGYALLANDHVRVDILYGKASPRRKALIDFLGTYLFLFPFCLLILWTASPYVGQSWAVREGSAEQSGVPALFLLKSCIPAFAVLVAMAGFSLAARAGDILREGAKS